LQGCVIVILRQQRLALRVAILAEAQAG